MSAQHAEPGFRPPQQARSRESLQKVLTSAEHVLSTGGIDEFTVAAVAEHAGVSVGAIYRRFTGKEQLLKAVKDDLLKQLETGVAEALRAASPGLRGAIGAFTDAMARTFSGRTRAFPELLGGQPAEGVERGLQALETIQRALVESAEPYLDDVAQHDPRNAVRFAARSIIGSCVHRAATCQSWPDGLSWQAWADATTEMAMTYLASRPQEPSEVE
ncbi:TetR/AcrR family transcriptional regulator [Saccharopolyspora sp. WRP15-2]|uniref:TetR/AcrR family transcriptional regulator n=1 Tax=Saccharopolyspora oryzae TaxID=2997343 RepID=A0ABT4V9K1_9PSEU|nr:TetR/AcrR family transcriptional regulator [Saccharopolyspora oryzae]MDA3630099.1 TetR/AcrR family transcriptional regulator [Saccharopolyspora oryzae]